MPSELNKKSKMNLICFTATHSIVLRKTSQFQPLIYWMAKTLFILTTFQTMFYALCCFYAHPLFRQNYFLMEKFSFYFHFFGFSDLLLLLFGLWNATQNTHPHVVLKVRSQTDSFFFSFSKIKSIDRNSNTHWIRTNT